MSDTMTFIVAALLAVSSVGCQRVGPVENKAAKAKAAIPDPPSCTPEQRARIHEQVVACMGLDGGSADKVSWCIGTGRNRMMVNLCIGGQGDKHLAWD